MEDDTFNSANGATKTAPSTEEFQDKHSTVSGGQSLDGKLSEKQKEIRFKAAHGLLVAFLLLIALLHAAGTYLFVDGFLLTRVVLDQKSSCGESPATPYGGYRAGSYRDGCWHPKSFDKAIIIFIDALRYDFTVPVAANSSGAPPKHYQNALTILHEQAVADPQLAFLRPFIADPPTSTMQRIKGLTTGTLPTFIEIGSNFAAKGMQEDNLIEQMSIAGKNLVHLGDDTWDALFPEQFDMNLTKSADSFNAWDLHTIDNLVDEHFFPLLEPGNFSRWDLLVAHYLGVDHAGHRYGPEHPAMNAKLKQMDGIVRRVMQLIDDKTLLIVLGDHGMDPKGDHGGETSDELESAIWMYSRSPFFGRLDSETVNPPATAKENMVNQIDLVPTLALLLGFPIPFNNLGIPIPEAFLSPFATKDMLNLANVNRLTTAQIQRYEQLYAEITKPKDEMVTQSRKLWHNATTAWKELSTPWRVEQDIWQGLAEGFSAYQEETLKMFKSLWARFDLISMSLGIVIMLLTLGIVIILARGFDGDLSQLSPTLLSYGSLGVLGGGCAGLAISLAVPSLGLMRSTVFLGALSSCLGILLALWFVRSSMVSVLPTGLWSWTCFIVVLLLCVGFGSNSFTIWEDEILLFMLASFGFLMLFRSLRARRSEDRTAGVLHSAIFLVAIRLASLSRLCREEQLSNCRTTFPASISASMSNIWQLLIPYAVAIALPSIIKAYYTRTQPWSGSAPLWIGVAYRTCLLLSAVYWTLDAADDGDWFEYNKDTQRRARQIVAQVVLMVAAGAGTATFGWQAPLIAIGTFTPEKQAGQTPSKQSSFTALKRGKSYKHLLSAATRQQQQSQSETEPQPQIVVQGTANLYGSHFAILPLTALFLPLFVLSKPMAQGVLALTTIAIFSLLELLAILRQSAGPQQNLYASALGPTVLALLGQFAFFKTGHQAILSSIQWNVAFIPMSEVRYPWAPLFVIFSTFAGQILCAAAVPLTVLWRRPYRFTAPGAGTDASGNMAIFSPPPTADAAVVPSTPASKQRETTSAQKTGQSSPSETPQTSTSPSPLTSPLPTIPDPRHTTRSLLLTHITHAYLTHTLIHLSLNTFTTLSVAHLRRHLMVYSIFCPRWMTGAAGLVVVELVGVLVGVGGVRWTVGCLAGVFGW